MHLIINFLHPMQNIKLETNNCGRTTFTIFLHSNADGIALFECFSNVNFYQPTNTKGRLSETISRSDYTPIYNSETQIAKKLTVVRFEPWGES